MKTKIIGIFFLFVFFNIHAQHKKWSLQDCVNYALDNNISIKQQELNNKLLEEDVTNAKGNFFPSLNGSASHNYNFGSFIDIDGGRISRDSRSNNFSLSTGATLFNGLRNKNNLLLAKKQLEAAGFDLEESKNSIMLFVVNSYLNVLLAKENIIIANDQVAISKNQVEKAKDLVQAGSSPKADLLEAEASLANNEQQLVKGKNSLDLALLSLAQLLQISNKGFDVEEVELNINSANLLYNDTDAIYNKALTILPEIQSANLAVENAKTGIKMAKSWQYPSLSFGGGLGTSYQHLQGQPDVRVIIDPNTNLPVTVPNGFGKQLGDNLGYNFGFSLSIPIFNRFQTKTGINKAKINEDRAELQLLDKKLKLRESIEKAYADAKAALNEYIAAKKSLKAQKESFKNAQVSYNSGVMNFFDFDQIRNRLVNAKSSMVNAKYNFVFRTKLLEYYYGIPITIK
ncbi:MAG: TolC family protein [Lutibacter sp.]